MNKKQLQVVLDDLAAVQSYEYHQPVLPTSGAITDQLVQKLKINSYQRKIRNFEVGSRVCKTVPHANIRVVKELEVVKDRIIDAQKRNKILEEGRREIVEEAKDRYKVAQNDILSCESALKKWELLEKDQKRYMKLVKKEIENINSKCISLIEKINLIKKVRNYGLKFYKDYYLYVQYMDDVRNNYACVIPFAKFKEFLDEHYVKKDEKRFNYEKNVKKLFLENDALKVALDGPFRKCKETLKEALSYYDEVCDEESKCSRYKDLLYKTRKVTRNLNSDKELALIALDTLISRLMDTFPKRLFKGLDLNTLQGKLKVVSFSYEAYIEMNRLIEMKCADKKWDLHHLAVYDSNQVQE